jgi:hypothetical protein
MVDTKKNNHEIKKKDWEYMDFFSIIIRDYKCLFLFLFHYTSIYPSSKNKCTYLSTWGKKTKASISANLALSTGWIG